MIFLAKFTHTDSRNPRESLALRRFVLIYDTVRGLEQFLYGFTCLSLALKVYRDYDSIVWISKAWRLDEKEDLSPLIIRSTLNRNIFLFSLDLFNPLHVHQNKPLMVVENRNVDSNWLPVKVCIVNCFFRVKSLAKHQQRKTSKILLNDSAFFIRRKTQRLCIIAIFDRLKRRTLTFLWSGF